MRKSASRTSYELDTQTADETVIMPTAFEATVGRAEQGGDDLVLGRRQSNDLNQKSGLRGVVRFPDGEEVAVEFNSAELTEQRELSGIDLGDFETLKQLAQGGNGAAAYRVYLFQVQCSSVPSTSDALEGAVAQMYETYSIPDSTSESGTRQLGSETDIGAMERRMRAHYARCQNVYDEAKHEKDSLDYLQIAADAGVYGATLEYARRLENDDVESAVQYFDKAWNHGDVNAALALGNIYLKGYGAETPNRLKAYAYTYLGTQLSAAFYDGQKGDAFDIVRPIVAERSKKLLAEFYPSESEAATPLAKAVLKENSNCCVY